LAGCEDCPAGRHGVEAEDIVRGNSGGPSYCMASGGDKEMSGSVLHIVSDESDTFASGAFAADIDGDGDADLVDNGITWYENTDGRGTSWTVHDVQRSGVLMGTGLWYDPYVGHQPMGDPISTDIDGDGDIDIVSTHTYGQVVWYENKDGKGKSWAENNVTKIIGGNQRIVIFAADIDGDDDIDLAIATDKNT
jgi:hypothetical protein